MRRRGQYPFRAASCYRRNDPSRTPRRRNPGRRNHGRSRPPEGGIVVNGSRRPLPRPASVRGALDALGLAGRPVAVELNGRLVRRADHPRTAVRTGDRVEIVTFVGGG